MTELVLDLKEVNGQYNHGLLNAEIVIMNTIMEGSSKNLTIRLNKTPYYQINATFLQCIG
jgi:hypothetical protein